MKRAALTTAALAPLFVASGLSSAANLPGISFGGRDLISRMLNAIPLESGRKITVSFDLARAHLFATDGGRAVATIGG